jgi:ATP-binding protein involved in chromosome partitioning
VVTESVQPENTSLQAAISTALANVIDPEIRKPITELGMVERVTVAPDGATTVRVLLTVSGCPMREKLTTDVTAAVAVVPGVSSVTVDLGVMDDAQRTELRTKLRGDNPVNEIPFAQPGSRTRVYAVASGKGGVGKSSVTVNLAVALAQRGLQVGVLDADIYGFSVPRMLGVTGKPTQVEKMIMPPQAHGVRVISIGMFTPGNTAVVWRGPMLHRALQQFLADVFWGGDLDVLLMDLPPGTGDIAISLAQLVPSSELLIVTTPQLAAREVAERAGSIALQTHQQIVGVVENMSWLDMPDGSKLELFGAGGGQAVANSLTESTGTKVGLLGQVPIDVAVREGGDDGSPIVLTHPKSEAAKAFGGIADTLAGRQRSLVGRSLGLSPAGR